MGQVLLAGRNWKARALLRAQLIEEGLEVGAYETVADALGAVEGRFRPPALLIVDLAASRDPSAEIGQLAGWSARFPVWVIASRTSNPEADLNGRGLTVLWRPVGVRELVERIKERVASGN